MLETKTRIGIYREISKTCEQDRRERKGDRAAQRKVAEEARNQRNRNRNNEAGYKRKTKNCSSCNKCSKEADEPFAFLDFFQVSIASKRLTRLIETSFPSRALLGEERIPLARTVRGVGGSEGLC